MSDIKFVPYVRTASVFVREHDPLAVVQAHVPLASQIARSSMEHCSSSQNQQSLILLFPDCILHVVAVVQLETKGYPVYFKRPDSFHTCCLLKTTSVMA